jgi:hypothetical protein
MTEGHGCGIGHGLHATMGVNWEKECAVGWGRRVGGSGVGDLRRAFASSLDAALAFTPPLAHAWEHRRQAALCHGKNDLMQSVRRDDLR